MDQDFITILLCGSIAFHLLMTAVSMIFIRKVKRDQRRRQKMIMDQAKINAVLQETVELKELALRNYQDILDSQQEL